ncbi:MAG: DUF433 domain-containing protein [Microbacteriaceae bacterium]|nr:DUF433 domain-containing protein [Microbacteriaceae bacterium]
MSINPLLLDPLYTQGEAASLLATPQSTFNRWVHGYISGVGNWQQPFVTTSGPGRGVTVPFVGVAEAWVVRAFRTAGVSLPRIRAAVETLREGIGVDHALASERLKTDGADILWDLQTSDNELDNRLVVVRNGNAVFGEVVREHLTRVIYRDGFAGSLTLKRADGIDVLVDPSVAYGQPVLDPYGVKVSDVIARIESGESIDDIALDWDIPRLVVANLALAA